MSTSIDAGSSRLAGYIYPGPKAGFLSANVHIHSPSLACWPPTTSLWVLVFLRDDPSPRTHAYCGQFWDKVSTLRFEFPRRMGGCSPLAYWLRASVLH